MLLSTVSERNTAESAQRMVKQIWAIGGGKGGVGKSLISSSLAIALANLGQEVIAIDLDLGGANLHTALGMDPPKQTLSDYFSKRSLSMDQCIVSSGISRLSVISGAQDAAGIANLAHHQKQDLLNCVRFLKADYLIFDLGAGTGVNTLDFFIASDVGIITLLPEPTSIENSYRFIKSAYYRYLMLSEVLKPVHSLIEMAMDSKNTLGIQSPADLFREVNRVNPELGIYLKREIQKFSPALIVNQARTQTDIDIGTSVKAISKKYFGIEMDYLGYLDYDSAVWQSIRRKKPLMLEFPHSKLVLSIIQIVDSILKKHGLKKNSFRDIENSWNG